MSQETDIDSLIYIFNRIKISIQHNQNVRIGMVNNAKVDMTENQFRSIILMQEIIKNGVNILKTEVASKQHEKIDHITPTLDLNDILFECNIFPNDMAIDGQYIGGIPNNLGKMLHLLPEI